eukprot:UN16321
MLSPPMLHDLFVELGQWLFLIWFPHSYQNFSWKPFKYILPMAILDGLGAVCAMTSISLVGSGLLRPSILLSTCI